MFPELTEKDPYSKYLTNRESKEALLKQHAQVIWMCGLSGAGKSTLATKLDRELYNRGFLSQVLDGDAVRSGLNKGLGYSPEERMENLRRVAEVAKLFLGCGVITIVAFISPTNSYRQMAKNIIGEQDFIETYINAPLEVCDQRDTKGLYKQAREGKIRDFTGITAPFEPPDSPALEINTSMLTVEESTSRLLDFVLPRIFYSS
jgi:adenylylsulfate kinase